MTNKEKSRMLSRILSTPIKSSYMKRIPAFAFIYSSHYTKLVFASCLVMVVSLGGAVYASGDTAPGDLFYPIKTKVVEPVLDIVNSSPEKKIVWEEEKVTRRISEAEKLLEKDELDDGRLEELERSIEKSSIAFAEAAIVVASSATVSTSSAREKANSLKQEFRKKIDKRRAVEVKSEQEIEDAQDVGTEKESSDKNKKRVDHKKKIKRLKDAAIRSLDDDSEEDDRDENENKYEDKQDDHE